MRAHAIERDRCGADFLRPCLRKRRRRLADAEALERTDRAYRWVPHSYQFNL